MTEQAPLCRNRLHEMTPDNIYVRPSDGGHRCLACKQSRLIRWRAENTDRVQAWRREYHLANREQALARYRKRRQEIKQEALAHYGGIRQLAEALKFTLFRPGPGNGPAHGQALEVVPLSELGGLLTEGDTT